MSSPVPVAERAAERARTVADHKRAVARRAREAFGRGEAAGAAGRLADAVRWLDRAHRLARADDTIGFALALARIRTGDAAGAVALLLPIARRLDLRQAWLGLAIARRMQGLAAASARMAAEALSRHAFDAADPSLPPILGAIAAEAGAAGWCAVTADGSLVGAVTGAAALAFRLDDGPPIRVPTGRDATGAFAVALPAAAATAAALTIDAGGRTLLADRIELRAVDRVDGMVEPDGAGGLVGWAWPRGAPERDPVLLLLDAAGTTVATVATSLAIEPAIPDRSFGMLPRGFRVPAECCPPGLLRVVDARRRPLAGSPVDPGIERRALLARLAGDHAGAASFAPVHADTIGPFLPARGSAPVPTSDNRRRRAGRRLPPVAIVIPVHGDLRRTLDCLDAVFRTVPADTAVHVVDDASPVPALVDALEALRAQGRIALHRHPDNANRGFPASADLGVARAGRADVVLLNSDTRPEGDWFARLRRAAHASPDIASATPLTNEGSIVAYPIPSHPNEMPSPEAGARLARLAAAANDGQAVDIPVGNGFCLYLRRDALDACGGGPPFRTDLWGGGYGEENDWCLRARHAGRRHVACLDAFVAHEGGRSFGAARAALLRRNGRILERLHPGYDALIAAFVAADPLAPARRRLDELRLRDAADRADGVVLFVSHAAGGGVERFVRARRAAVAASGALALTLRGDPDGLRDDLAVLDAAPGLPTPNLRYRLPAERGSLGALLASLRPTRVEMHHLLGHAATVPDLCAALGVPVTVWLHDYAAFCHRIALFGPARRYCGEPDRDGCRRCVAELGSALDDTGDVDALLERSALLAGVAARIVAPGRSVAARFAAHFPGVAAPVVEPWEDERDLPPPTVRLASRRPRRVLVPGGIGPEKGLDVLIACARDADRRALPLSFTVVGHTADDDRVLAFASAFVTGPYEHDEAVALFRAADADLAFIPSVWPETWCYVLGECWRAGLEAAVFDLGTPAERVRRRGAGLLLPFDDLDPVAINDALLAADDILL